MRTTYDRGYGASRGRQLGIHIGPGRGYLRQWWVHRNAGPGKATSPGCDCGHFGLSHCNSAYCSRAWCKAPLWPVLGWFLRGHSLYLWLGPTYFPTWRQALSRALGYLR